jgi:hypothetical protein
MGGKLEPFQGIGKPPAPQDTPPGPPQSAPARKAK